jgi:hypothetical protein
MGRAYIEATSEQIAQDNILTYQAGNKRRLENYISRNSIISSYFSPNIIRLQNQG